MASSVLIGHWKNKNSPVPVGGPATGHVISDHLPAWFPASRNLPGGYTDLKTCSGAGFTGLFNRKTGDSEDLPDVKETEPGIFANTLHEYPVLHAGCDTYPVIFAYQEKIVTIPFAAEPYRPDICAVAYCVFYQVEDDLGNKRIRINLPRTCVADEINGVLPANVMAGRNSEETVNHPGSRSPISSYSLVNWMRSLIPSAACISRSTMAMSAGSWTDSRTMSWYPLKGS